MSTNNEAPKVSDADKSQITYVGFLAVDTDLSPTATEPTGDTATPSEARYQLDGYIRDHRPDAL